MSKTTYLALQKVIWEFKQTNFFIAFSSIMGILGSITFLHNENVLEKELENYCEEIAKAICRTLN